MRKITAIFVVTGMLFIATIVSAADTYVKGTVSKVGSDSVTLVDKNNHSVDVNVTSSTVVISKYTKSKISHRYLLRGSVVKATVRNGNAIVLVLEEEPK
jgi:hypothetical protein